MSDADGTNERRLLPGYHPDWSPDGRRIVFTDRAEILVMDSDGSNLIRLTTTDPDAWVDQPVWARSGERIAFTRYLVQEGSGEPAALPEIRLIAADGSSANGLSYDQKLCSAGEQSPAWTKDGLRIAFMSPCLGIVAVDTHPATARLQSIVPNIGLRRVSEPAWSPDGSRVLLVARWLTGFAARPSIFVANTNIGVPRLLIPDGHDPAWSPDGAHIAFVH